MIKFREKEEPQIANYDVELISLVKDHDFLYDVKNTDYRNLPLRANVWATISKTLNIEDQNLVQKRWKVLREKFSVAYRKFKKDQIAPTWSLYDSCTFLEPYVNLKPDYRKNTEEEEQKAIEVKQTLVKSIFDESKLTNLVKERPVLYDRRHEDFRSPNLRRKAWNEVAAICGWEVKSLQKRWRVMRDRFVRELRRTKNIDSDKQINCSAFFRDMLFLVSHVKSKRYEAEATDLMSDGSQDNWDHHESSEDESKLHIDQLETCMISETIKEGSSQETYELEVSDQYVECYDEGGNVLEHEDYDEETVEENEEIADREDLFEAEEEAFSEENMDQIHEDDILVSVEEIKKEEWLSENTHKHRLSVDFHEEPVVKRKLQQSESSLNISRRVEEPNDSADENVMFGKTIGIMLQKYPAHLQTAVKLELLQSLANFDIKHNFPNRQ